MLRLISLIEFWELDLFTSDKNNSHPYSDLQYVLNIKIHVKFSYNRSQVRPDITMNVQELQRDKNVLIANISRQCVVILVTFSFSSISRSLKPEYISKYRIQV